MAYRNDNENLKVRLKYCQGVIALLVLMIAGLGVGWDRARQEAVIHLPPNLEDGAQVKLNQPQRSHIFAFASRILQVINHWQNNGATDYGKAIDSVKPYLTPRFYAELKYDLEQRLVNPVDGTGTAVDELTGRVRSMQILLASDHKIFADDRVTARGQGEWVAQLDMHIEEQVKGMLVKSVNVRYPVRVVRYDVDLNANQWGLALDGYAEPGPTRLSQQPGAITLTPPTQLPTPGNQP